MTAAIFKAMFPEFASITDDRINALLLQADAEFDVGVWGSFYSIGLGNWIAHNLVLYPDGLVATANAGDITSKSVGSVSVSRSGALLEEQVKNPYLLTRYGQRYWSYVQTVGMGAVVV